MAKRTKPTLKELDELRAEIKSLNYLLLEMKDHYSGLEEEKGQYKEALIKLMTMVLNAEDSNLIKQYARNEIKQLVS